MSPKQAYLKFFFTHLALLCSPYDQVEALRVGKEQIKVNILMGARHVEGHCEDF